MLFWSVHILAWSAATWISLSTPVYSHLPHCGIIYIFWHITICSEVIYMHKEGNRSQKSTLWDTCFICFHSDVVLPICMHCFLSHRKFFIHLIRKSDSPAFASIGRRILWSTLSKAFLKSSRILTTFPFGLRAASQQCTSSPSASTVELPLTEPYWWCQLNL